MKHNNKLSSKNTFWFVKSIISLISLCLAICSLLSCSPKVKPFKVKTLKNASSNSMDLSFNHSANNAAPTINKHGALIFDGVEYTGIKHIILASTISPDGKSFYVADSSSNLVTFQRDVRTGTLANVGTKPLLFTVADDESIGGFHVAPIALSLSVDGSTLYALDGAALLVFKRDHESASLKLLDIYRSTVGYYFQKDSIVIYPGDGEIKSMPYKGIQSFDSLYKASSLVISPDDKHLYIMSNGHKIIGAFNRDANTGKLSFIKDFNSSEASIGAGVNGLAISPDGLNVYAGSTSKALVVFKRNKETGELRIIEIQKNGRDGVELSSVGAVTVSPDGRHVYVGGYQSLAIFEREISTGELLFIESLKGKFGGTVFGGGFQSVVVSLDNKTIYLASRTDNAIVSFRRNTKTGKLDLIEVIKESVVVEGGVNGVTGLYRISTLLIDPGNNFVYAGGICCPLSNRRFAISIFKRLKFQEKESVERN